MRTRSAAMRAVGLACALTACVHDPDPRPRTPESVTADAHGGWIVVELSGGTAIAGELIDVQPLGLHVATHGGLQFEHRGEVLKATLYAYHPDVDNFLGWTALGVLATISNGVFLVFTAPAWLITGSLSSRAELHGVMLEYPDDAKWDALSPWARFPQGLPRNLSDSDLVRQYRVPSGPPGSVSAGSASPGAPSPVAPSPSPVAPSPVAPSPVAPSPSAGSGSGSAPDAPAGPP